MNPIHDDEIEEYRERLRQRDVRAAIVVVIFLVVCGFLWGAFA